MEPKKVTQLQTEEDLIAYVMERTYLMETLYDLIDEEFYGEDDE